MLDSPPHLSPECSVLSLNTSRDRGQTAWRDGQQDSRGVDGPDSTPHCMGNELEAQRKDVFVTQDPTLRSLCPDGGG